MSATDTGADAVERLAVGLDDYATMVEHALPGGDVMAASARETAATLRALVQERDRLREALRRIASECGRARGDQGHRDASRFAFAVAYKAAGEGSD